MVVVAVCVVLDAVVVVPDVVTLVKLVEVAARRGHRRDRCEAGAALARTVVQMRRWWRR